MLPCALACIKPYPFFRREEFAQKRIPGSVFFDLGVSERGSQGNSLLPNHGSRDTLVHALPSGLFFSELMRELGIHSNMTVVVYDSTGVWSSPRAWWLLRVFGHARAAVLDGGLPAWVGAGQHVESGPPAPTATILESKRRVSTFNRQMICSGELLVNATS